MSRIWDACRSSLRPLAIAVGIGALVGTLAGAYAAVHQPADQIILGNTSGSLGALLFIDGKTVAIGGGSTRTGMAELAGRSVVPWDRRIDLLVVPAADDEHLLGALGMIERHIISGIAVVGSTADPGWDQLVRAAQRASIKVQFISGPHHLQLSSNAELAIDGSEGDGESARGATVALRYHGAQVTIVDRTSGTSTPLGRSASESPHVLITLRPSAIADDVTMLVRPQIDRASKSYEVHSQLLVELARGERCTIRLNARSIRMPRHCLVSTTALSSPAPSVDEH